MATRQEELAKRLQQQAEEERGGTPEAPPPPEQPKRARTPRATSSAPSDGWAGAQPKQTITRRPLNVGMPEVLAIHRRLGELTAQTGISAQDAAAEALDEWLTAKGYPRP